MTDNAAAPPARFPRGRRTGPSVLTALLVLVVAASVCYLAVLRALNRTGGGVDPAVVSRHLSGTRWDAPEVLIVGIVVAAVGLLLMLVAMLPASRHLVELTNPDSRTAAAMPPRSLRRTVQSAALEVDGISTARARIGRRRIRLDLGTGLRHTDGLTGTADTAATRRLVALDLSRPRTIAAHLSRKDI